MFAHNVTANYRSRTIVEFNLPTYERADFNGKPVLMQETEASFAQVRYFERAAIQNQPWPGSNWKSNSKTASSFS